MRGRSVWIIALIVAVTSFFTMATQVGNILKDFDLLFSSGNNEVFAEQAKKGLEEKASTPSDNLPKAKEESSRQKELSQKDFSESLSYLEKKERELNEKERVLAEKEALLQSLQKDIEAKLARLEEIQRNIEAFKKEQERLKNDKIDSLVKIYVNMKPKDASKLLEKMDDDLVVSIVSRMTTEQAAKIISSMELKKASQITEKLSKVKNYE